MMTIQDQEMQGTPNFHNIGFGDEMRARFPNYNIVMLNIHPQSIKVTRALEYRAEKDL